MCMQYQWLHINVYVFFFKILLQPKAVFFTCIDSRMIPTRFTETSVGDMFVVRNTGNVIPNSKFYPDEITTNEPAALELGCVVNDIRHIIVCGHSDCKVGVTSRDIPWSQIKSACKSKEMEKIDFIAGDELALLSPRQGICQSGQ